jgi:hypothetical protein
MQPFFQWKSNKYYIFWVRICSLRNPACNALAPYCQLWPVRLSNIPQHYPTNSTIFEVRKKVTEQEMCVLYTPLLSKKISHSKKKWVGYDQKCILVFNVNCPLFLSSFNETWLDRLSKNTQISNFMKIRPVGAESMQTDGRSSYVVCQSVPPLIFPLLSGSE